MQLKKSLHVSLLTLFLFAFEIFIFSFTKMKLALGAGTAASFIAYSFQGLMMLTLATGAAFPLGALIEKKSGRQDAGLVAALGIMFVVMAGFSAVSFLRVSSVKSPAKTETVPAQGGESKDLSRYIEFTDAEAKEISPQILETELRFKNKSNRDITELDYVFVAVEDVHVFYKIKIREAVYFPSKGTGSTKLTWDNTKLNTPKLFETFQRAYNNRKLKMFGKPTRITFIDGSVIEDKT